MSDGPVTTEAGPTPFPSVARRPPGQPGPWDVLPWDDFATQLRSRLRASTGRPVLAVDGRGGSGKTVLTDALAARWPGSSVVHTDDIAWWESFFGWTDLLVDGVLRPVRDRGAVSFRPPAWERRGRPGAVEVAAGAGPVLVEGTGSSRLALTGWLAGSVWVDCDPDAAVRRLADRDGTSPEQTRLVEEWEVEEAALMTADRPWERATVLVSTSSGLVVDPDTEVAARFTAASGRTPGDLSGATTGR